MQFLLSTCQGHRQGPFAFDKGFPSELDLSGSIKVIVWTWHLEVLISAFELFFICFFYLSSLLFFVKKEEWFKMVIVDTNRNLQGKTIWRE